MAFYAGTRTHAAPTLATRIAEMRDEAQAAYSAWRLYRRTLGELQALSQRELDDLGISRASLRETAWNATYGAAR